MATLRSVDAGLKKLFLEGQPTVEFISEAKKFFKADKQQEFEGRHSFTREHTII
jgi:hypothetical protein